MNHTGPSGVPINSATMYGHVSVNMSAGNFPNKVKSMDSYIDTNHRYNEFAPGRLPMVGMDEYAPTNNSEWSSHAVSILFLSFY